MNSLNQYGIIIGVGKRPEDKAPMSMTAVDGENIATALKNRCGIPQEQIKLLLNGDASKENIIQALDDVIAATKQKKADTLWFYFSGHGFRDQIHGKILYYLVCNDTQNKNIWSESIPGTELVEKLSQIQTDKMIILLDCCHSGGVGLGEATNTPFDSKALLKNGNRVILSACHPQQVSFVSKPVSIFTYALIEGLAGKYFLDEDKDVLIFDLAMYVREQVYPLSKQTQQPQLQALNNGFTGNFAVVHYEEGKPKDPSFATAFKLYDESDKEINKDVAIERDKDYRKEFEWLQNNIQVGNIQAGGNVDIGDKNTTITQTHHGTGDNVAGNKTITTQNADKIYNIEKIEDAKFE